MSAELHHPVRVDRIVDGETHGITATPAQCAVLAARMMIPAVEAFACLFRLHPLPAGVILAEGSLRARVVQECVVTLEPFAAPLEEEFRVRFVPDGQDSDDTDPESDDEIPYHGGVIDLGEAAAEQLALALDPYPRAPGAALPDAASDDSANPFSALGRLRKP